MKSVIFDFDDTIVNNNIFDHASFVIPSKILKLAKPKISEIKNLRSKGYLAHDIINVILQRSKKPELYNNFVMHRNVLLYSHSSIKYLKLQKNVRNVLKFLKSKKINCLLCSSNKDRTKIMKFLKKNDLLNYFSGVYFMDDLGFRIDNSNDDNRILIKKSLLHHVIIKHQITNKEVIYIGNSIDDLTAADCMRIQFVYFENDYLPKLSNKHITKICNMKDLKTMIEGGICVS